MTSDLRIQGEVVVNSEQAESAFNRVGDKAQQMATEVATSAGKAGQAVDKIGDGAGASAEKFTRAESRISASIKRATNELELLGKTASQRLEFNIADKGLDPKKFEPALQKLREVEAQAQAAQRAASGSLDKMGISAAQTAAALRGVPAQFTDIITSLQGGQAPLTVFLQQGGQLKDMFGGAGAAARALGGYVVGLVNPFTVAAAAGAALAYAYSQGSKEADSYNKALITTGNAAGTNAAQLKAYAQEISAVVGTQGKAAESLAALASTGKIGAESLKEAAQAAVQYERATGQALDKTADQFASLRNEPLAAVLKLNDGMNFLTDSTYKQIKSLEEQGKTAEAANVAQRAFADTLAGRAGEMERNLGSVERGWLKVKDAAKGAWDAILNVGRASTGVDQLAEVRRQIALKESQIANAGFAANEGGAAFGRPSLASTERLRAELAGLQAQAAALEGVAYASRTAAEEERKRGEQVKATAAFDKAGEKYLTDKARMERELAAARVQGAEAGKSQAEIEQRLAQIRESYAKKGGGSSGIAAENKELRDQMRVFADLAGVSSTYYADLANAQKQRAAGVITEQQYVQVVEALIQKQPFAVAIAKKQADATKAQAQASEEAARAHLKYVESFGKGAAAAQQQADQLRTEEAAAAIAASGYYSLAQAIELVTIARLEEKRDGLMGNEEAYLAVQKEIDARKELLTLIGSKEARKAADDAAREAARDWERAAADINRSLTDALLRGFESGKSFARNLRDTLKNMFSTLVLRPVISAVMTPVSGMVNGMVQGGMNAVGLGGSSDLLGMASNARGAYSLLTGGSIGAGIAASLGSSITAIGTAIGSTAATSFGAGMAGATLAPGLMGPTTVGATGAMGAGAGMGSALAAIPGWGWAATGVLALLGSGAFSSRGANHSGGVFSTATTDRNAAAGALGLSGGALGDFTARGNTAIDAQLGTAVGALSGVYQSLAKYAGDSARQIDIVAGFAVNGKYKDEDAYGYFKLLDKLTGEELASYAKRDGGLGSDPEKAWAQYVADMGTALVGEIRKADIPKWMDNIFAGLGDNITTQGLDVALQQIAKIDGAFALLGNNIEYLADISGATQTALLELSGGIDALMANASAYYDNFYSADERRAAVQRQLQTAFDALNLKLPDIDAADARAQFRSLAEAQDLTTEAGQKTYAALLQLSGAFAGVTQSAEDAAEAARQQASEQAQSAVDAAFANVKAAIEREQQYWKDIEQASRQAVSALTGTLGLLTNNARELYGTVDTTQQMLAAQGMVYIEDALAAVRGGASATGYDGLQDAIGAARGGISGGVYASEFERQRDALVLAGQLSELGDLTSSQLSVEQRALDAAQEQIKQLDATLDYWKQQIDGTGQLIDVGLSIEGAIGQLSAALAQREAAKTAGGGGGGGGSPGAVDFNQGLQKQVAEAWNAGDWITAQNIIKGYGFSNDQLKEAFDLNYADLRYLYSHGYTNQNPGDYSFSAKTAEGVYAEARAQGLTLAEVDGLINAPAGTAEEWAKQNGLPIFHQGTNYVPRTGLALLEEGEAVVPRTYNPAYGPGAVGQGNADLLAELRALRAEVAALRAPMEQTAQSTTQHAMQFDNVTAGGNAMATEVFAV